MDINGFYFESGSTPYASPVAGEQKKTLLTGPGALHYLRVCNTTAAKIFVFVFDNTTDSGTLLLPPIPVAANDMVQLTSPGAALCTAGCTVAASTTQTGYAAAGANSLQLYAVTKG